MILKDDTKSKHTHNCTLTHLGPLAVPKSRSEINKKEKKYMNTDLSRFIQESTFNLWIKAETDSYKVQKGPASQSMRTVRDDATNWEIELLLGDYPQSKPKDLTISGKCFSLLPTNVCDKNFAIIIYIVMVHKF